MSFNCPSKPTSWGIGDKQQHDDEDDTSLQQELSDDITCLQDALAAPNCLTEQQHERQEALENYTQRVEELQRRLNIAVSNMSARKAASMQQALSVLSGRISLLRSEFLPKKKFSFRRPAEPKTASTDASGASVQLTGNCQSEAAAASQPEGSRDSPCGNNLPPQSTATNPQQPSDGASLYPSDGLNCTTTVTLMPLEIKNRSNARLVLAPTEICGCDCTLMDLNCCEIYLLGVVGAARIHRVKGSTIWLGAIASSVLIYGCEDCTFVVAAKQLRAHECKNVAFYLKTLSSPVIECTRNATFAPYVLNYPDKEEHWKHAGLDGVDPPESDGPSWTKVLDFDWHKKQASPHWRILPEAERIVASTVWLTPKAPRLSSGATTANLPPLGGEEGLVSRWDITGMPTELIRV